MYVLRDLLVQFAHHTALENAAMNIYLTNICIYMLYISWDSLKPSAFCLRILLVN